MNRMLFALLCCLLWSTGALAGAVFDMESTIHDPEGPQQLEMRLTVSGEDLKLVIAPAGEGGSHEMIYHGESQELVAVSHPDQMYVVMDRESMEDLQQKMQEAMAQMQKALEGMPEDQRAMAEQMMKDMGQLPAAPGETVAIDVHETGETKNVGGYDCAGFELQREGRVFQKVWVTDWKNVEGGKELAPVLREFSVFLEDTVGAAAGRMGFDLQEGPFAAWKKIDGCPVMSQQLEGGEVMVEATLKSSKIVDVDASVFEAPAGYTRQSFADEQ